jgi:hypothetical protein
MVPSPHQLKLQKTLEFVAVPHERTFIYRQTIHQVIEFRTENEYLFRRAEGPFIYAVTDADSLVRYIGKSWETHLYQRWIRPAPYIRHKESRNFIIGELAKNRELPALWSAQIASLKKLLPSAAQGLDHRTIAKGLEALWLDRWFEFLWNEKREALVDGFFDGDFWANSGL